MNPTCLRCQGHQCCTSLQYPSRLVQLHPPAPELTLFWWFFIVNTHRQAIKKYSGLLLISWFSSRLQWPLIHLTSDNALVLVSFLTYIESPFSLLRMTLLRLRIIASNMQRGTFINSSLSIRYLICTLSCLTNLRKCHLNNSSSSHFYSQFEGLLITLCVIDFDLIFFALP